MVVPFAPEDLNFAVPQPYEVDLSNTDGVFIRQIVIPKAGTFVPQHSHVYDHTSLLAVGSVRLWMEDVLVGDYAAPLPIRVRAGAKHTFLALTDGVVFYCVHNTMRTGRVEELERHHLPGAPHA